MTWLDDWAAAESRRLKDEQSERDEERRRKEDIADQGLSLWGDLQYWMQKGVERINNTPILHEKAGSNISYAELSMTSFEVRNVGYPRTILTVSRNGLYFKVNWIVIQSGEMGRGKVPGEDEVLTLDLDERDNLFVRSSKGDVLVREAVAEYLLHRFLI